MSDLIVNFPAARRRSSCGSFGSKGIILDDPVLLPRRSSDCGGSGCRSVETCSTSSSSASLSSSSSRSRSSSPSHYGARKSCLKNDSFAGSSSSSSNIFKKMKTKRSVAFSEIMDVCIVSPTGGSAADRWYSDKDYKGFKVANREAVVEVHRRFRGGNDQPREDEDVDDPSCLFAGLERLLTPRIIRRSQRARRECRDAVLDEQDRQYRESMTTNEDDGASYCDWEELARVSRKTTGWSRSRARTIGTLSAPK